MEMARSHGAYVKLRPNADQYKRIDTSILGALESRMHAFNSMASVSFTDVRKWVSSSLELFFSLPW